MKTSALALAAVFSLSAAVTAREWLSLNGRKLEADFIATDGTNVTLKRSSDGQSFTLPLAGISENDRNWVKQQAAGKPSAGPAKPLEGPFARLVTGEWELSEHGGMEFALYGGKDLNTSEKIPLVLSLHGKTSNNENGKQVSGWMKTFAKPENYTERPCFILAPMSTQPAAGDGVGWRNEQVVQVLKIVKALIKTLPVDPKRIYITGHSMGGHGTWHIMAAEPKLFAAAAAVACTCEPEDPGRLMHKPFRQFHAVDDQTAEVELSRDLAKKMKSNKEFKYTELPEGGHGVVGKVFADSETHKWLFEQRLK
jgi:dienelactone hydrolase